MRRNSFVLLLVSVIIHAQGQSFIPHRQFNISKTGHTIEIDGLLDDEAWNTAASADGFLKYWPSDSGLARLQTEVKLLYNDQFLFIGIKAYHTERELVIQSLKRDVNPWYSDGVSIILDPADRNLSGYVFGVNAGGAQFEGIVEVNDVSFDWDTKWFSDVKRFKDYWTAEMAIPFRSLRYPRGQTQWGLNFIRNDMTNNCFDTWNHVPIQFYGFNLNYLGQLYFKDDVPDSKNNYSLFPYFTTKIDQGRSNENDVLVPVPIFAGIRLTGSINPKLRVGIINVQSGKKPDLSAQNYSVVSFDQRILKRSNIRGMFTNRNTTSESVEHLTVEKFNRVTGLEFNFLSNDTKFNGRTGYYHSFTPQNQSSSGFGLANVGFTNRNWNVTMGWMQLSKNFISDMGFTPRLYNYDAVRDTTLRIGYIQYSTGIDYSLYPRYQRVVNSVVWSAKSNHYLNDSQELLEFTGEFSLRISFADRKEASATWVQDNVNLLYATNIFQETGILNEGLYNFGFLRLKYSSNFLLPFSWGITLESGDYYNGTRNTVIGNIKYRRQPWGNFGIDFTYNEIKLKKKVRPYIMGPTIEIFFSRLISWTTFLQYNTEFKNFNINSRLQWRFRPMSDIFLVYSDNYLTDDLANINRGLVLKISLRVN